MEANTETTGGESTAPAKKNLTRQFVIVGAALLVVFGGIFGYKGFIAYMTAEYLAKNAPYKPYTDGRIVVK